MSERTPATGFSYRSSGHGIAVMSVRIVLGITLLVAAALALAAGIRLIVAHRLPDGTLSLGVAVALGTCGVVWLLIERRIAASRRTAPVAQTR